MREFYGHFAEAYGTFWLVLMVAAVLTQSSIETGWIGMAGFPAVALIYALSRRGRPSSELVRLRQSIEVLEAKLADHRSTPASR